MGAVALIGERRQVSESAPIAGYGEQLNNQTKDRTMTTTITLTYRVRLPSGITGPELTFLTSAPSIGRGDALQYAVAEVRAQLERNGVTRRDIVPIRCALKGKTMTTEITFQGHALTCACGHSGRDVLPAYGCDAICVSCIADTANACWPHTRLDAGSDRETVVNWLAGNDRNGCYLDDDMTAEGWAPMTLADAWRQVAIAHEIADPDHDPTPLA